MVMAVKTRFPLLVVEMMMVNTSTVGGGLGGDGGKSTFSIDVG